MAAQLINSNYVDGFSDLIFAEGIDNGATIYMKSDPNYKLSDYNKKLHGRSCMMSDKNMFRPIISRKRSNKLHSLSMSMHNFNDRFGFIEYIDYIIDNSIIEDGGGA